MTNSDPKPKLIVICGATASGKTGFSIELAKKLNCPIISYDSRQFYREMNIGTAKPTESELKQAKHYFIDNRSITDPVYTAGIFEQDALKCLSEIFQNHDKCIAVGGSGLYINALCFGIDDIPKDEKMRDEMEQRWKTEGLEKLQEELKNVDPEYYAQADIKNPRRVMRALEVYHLSGKTYSSYRQNKVKTRPFEQEWLGIDREREELFDRINKRVDQMIENGLIEEVKLLMKYRELKALKTVGYKEVFKHMDGEVSLDQAIHNIKRNTRVYAKKQIGWFRKNPKVNWIKPSEIITFSDRYVQNLSN